MKDRLQAVGASNRLGAEAFVDVCAARGRRR
jgi:hypothetical protein